MQQAALQLMCIWHFERQPPAAPSHRDICLEVHKNMCTAAEHQNIAIRDKGPWSSGCGSQLWAEMRMPSID